LVSVDGKTVTFLEHGGEVTDVAFSNDSSLVATSGADGKILFWDVQSGEKQFELNNLEPVNSIAISPNRSLIAAGLHDKIKIWDWSTKEEVSPELSQQGDIVTVVFSPDGKMFAAGSADGTAILWKVDGNTFAQMGETINLTSARRMLLAFSPDGKWLAGGALGFAYLWDTVTVQEFARIPHGSNPVTSVSFTNDGTKLLTVSRKVVRIWDMSALPLVPDDKLIGYACSHLTSNLSQDDWTAYFGDTQYNLTCPDLMEKK
jgi:WD40 repeat protein